MHGGERWYLAVFDQIIYGFYLLEPSSQKSFSLLDNFLYTERAVELLIFINEILMIAQGIYFNFLFQFTNRNKHELN